VLGLLLLFLVAGLVGCAGVRTVGMHQVGVTQVPVPAGGRIEGLWADGRMGPSVMVHVGSSLKADELLAWYREALPKRGWNVKEGPGS
jgi:hypothetical protein